MNTQTLIFDTINFKEALDTVLEYSYQGVDRIRILDIFDQEVTIYSLNGETKIMSDKKDVIWGANNSKGSQARLVEWLISDEDNK